jgi:hypothetical protein
LAFIAEAYPMRDSPSTPSPGQIARIRQRLYLVEQIIPETRSGDSTLVRMSCVDDDNQGQPLEVLWERDLDPEILTGESWESIAQQGFDEPKLFQAYLKTLTWKCVTSTDPQIFQSRESSGMSMAAFLLHAGVDFIMALERSVRK